MSGYSNTRRTLPCLRYKLWKLEAGTDEIRTPLGPLSRCAGKQRKDKQVREGMLFVRISLHCPSVLPFITPSQRSTSILKPKSCIYIAVSWGKRHHDQKGDSQYSTTSNSKIGRRFSVQRPALRGLPKEVIWPSTVQYNRYVADNEVFGLDGGHGRKGNNAPGKFSVHRPFSSSNVLENIADGTCVSESFTYSRRMVYT